ncbi:sensor histidine kinase [Acanthopleuribacter pedis]|uniref:Histidine kinase domain-containing protein n=1 Tax=Acanthopleuribacter pedis TaxID=442870 RepID=A0A8J7U380_9BACT|nr:sensor histidine kinase [Acanthopleuribacter pedis]MBO1318058.1 hypothetical protein [Acanthopleuribacter pedis]
MLHALLWLMVWDGAGEPVLPERLRFEHISVEHGLSQSTAQTMIQDQAGYLWIGTFIGLNRYDGYRFETFRHDPANPQSLPSNHVNALMEDHRGRLWIATMGGLCRYDGRDTSAPRFHRFPVNPDDENALFGDDITHVLQDHRGDIWVASRGMLHRYREAHDDFERFSVPHYQITGLAEDRWGRLWVATVHGMVMFDVARQPITLFGLYGRRCRTDTFMPINHVTSLFHDAAGDLWAAFPGVGMVLIPEDVSESQPLMINIRRLVVHDGIQDRDGLFWLATSAGVLLIEPKTMAWTRAYHDPKKPGSLSTDTTHFVFQDRQGTVWIGSLLGGLNKYVPHKPVFEHFKPNPFLEATLKGGFVNSFSEGPTDVLWIGSRPGLSAFQVSARRFLRLVGDPALDTILQNHRVVALHVDQRGDLWIGGDRQLLVVTPADFDPLAGTIGFRNFRRYHARDLGRFAHVSGFFEDGDTMWVTTFGAGLLRTQIGGDSHRFQRFTQTGKPGSLSSHLTRCAFRDRLGQLWVGTWRNGLNRMDEREGTFTTFRSGVGPDRLSEDTITALAQSARGNRIWVATYGGGLNALDPATGRFTAITTRDGLPDNTVYGILVHGDDLWVSTNHGIACIADADDPGRRTIRRYAVHDGLQSQEFNRGAFFKGRAGWMVMGGINGFNLFDPSTMNEPIDAGDVVLSDVFVNGRSRRFEKPLHQLSELSFGPETRMIGFAFTSLNFAAPGRNHYAYRLDGVDAEWHQAEDRNSLQYSNLDPGSYVLRAYTLNREGDLSGRELRLALTIEPAFHQTWLFRASLLLAVGLMIGGVIWWRFDTLQREQQRRRDFARGLIEAQERDRARIADELHDSLGQNLLVINNELQLQAQMPHAAALQEDLMQMSHWVVDAVEEVRRIAYNLRPHQLDRLGLKRAIRSMANLLTRGGNLQLKLVLDDIEGLLDKERETHLFRIVQEGLHNMVRHAGADQIELHLTHAADRLTMVLTDNGRGFDVKAAERLGKGMGLRTMAERADLMGGILKLESQPGGGTRLTLTVSTVR